MSTDSMSGSEKLPPTLLIKHLARGRMTSADDGADLFRIVEARAPRLMPGVAGPDEPPRARFDADRLRREWGGGGWSWRSAERPAAEGTVSHDPIDPERGLSIVTITAPAEVLEASGDTLDVAGLLRDLALRFDAWFGYAHVLTARDRWTFGGSDPYSEAWMTPGLEIHERRLRGALPPLPWATVLGGDLLERVGGGERLRDAPAAVAEVLEGRIGYLQLTEAPLDTLERFDAVAAARDAVQASLGPELFSRETTPPSERRPAPGRRAERNPSEDAAELLAQCFAAARDLLLAGTLPPCFGVVLRQDESATMIPTPEDLAADERREWLLDQLTIEAAKRDVVCVAFVTADGPHVSVALEHRDDRRMLVERTLERSDGRAEWTEPRAGDTDLHVYGRWRERLGNPAEGG